MAERLAIAYAAQMNLANIKPTSAGTRAVVARPLHHQAASVLEKLGGDASGFAARQITTQILDDADLVLTMTTAHREAALAIAPYQLRRVFTLSEAAQIVLQHGVQRIADLPDLRSRLVKADLVDIRDPLGGGEATFALVASQIADRLPPILRICSDV